MAMKVLRGLLYIAVLNIFGYYALRIQLLDGKLTSMDIYIVVTCFGLASIVGMYRQKQQVERIKVRIEGRN
jgi:hypothetical protein